MKTIKVYTWLNSIILEKAGNYRVGKRAGRYRVLVKTQINLLCVAENAGGAFAGFIHAKNGRPIAPSAPAFYRRRKNCYLIKSLAISLLVETAKGIRLYRAEILAVVVKDG